MRRARADGPDHGRDRAFGLTVGALQWLAHAVPRFGARRTVPDLERPLSVAGLTPDLARLARQTRALALELRRRSEEARHWPDDAGELAPIRLRWWSSLVADPIDISPLLDTRRDVYDWLDSVAGLSASDRERLAELGIDAEAVRAVLTSEQAVGESVRTLAGLLWGIDERLAGAEVRGYRSGGLDSAPTGLGFGGAAANDNDTDSSEEARRRRYARLVAAQRRGLSRMAADYAKTSAEREDLEQDIALALWQALPRFRGDSTIETFAYRVAKFCCFRHLRRRTKHRTDSDEVTAIDDPQACVESWLLRADELARVEQARAALPDSLEAPLSLHLSGMSYAEIAARLGISEQNVSVRLTRARHKLRAQLATAA